MSDTKTPIPTNGSKNPSIRSHRPNRGVRYRSRLLCVTVPAELPSLSEQMEKLSKSGYSPTSVTGVGKHLFILMEHEHTLGMRTFGPMAQFFELMNSSDEAEENDNGATTEIGDAGSPAVDDKQAAAS